ncbi:hypothetical protein TNCV_2879791 [Trichonephila clavipes]|uniref:Uncharacterized protein n=1 Tax=Trichonephila clavipes TaxID=2585209 RepID=A0A8X6W2K4_TRICX|nr:hypothetical protein TNCV_2879791 [Trichonephila clavipes]
MHVKFVAAQNPHVGVVWKLRDWRPARHPTSGCSSPVIKVSDHGRHVTSSSPVPLQTRRVGLRCTLNMLRAETASPWGGVVVRRGGASSGVVHVT